MREPSAKKKKKETGGQALKAVRKTNSRGKVTYSAQIIQSLEEPDATLTLTDLKRILTNSTSDNPSKKSKTSHNKGLEANRTGKKKPSKKAGKVIMQRHFQHLIIR